MGGNYGSLVLDKYWTFDRTQGFKSPPRVTTAMWTIEAGAFGPPGLAFEIEHA